MQAAKARAAEIAPRFPPYSICRELIAGSSGGADSQKSR
jgi:hypothetical protein